MRRLKQLLQSKNGFSYPLTCAAVIILSMILSLWMEYAAVQQEVSAHKESVRLKLESVLTAYAKEHYEELREGEGTVFEEAALQAAVWEKLELSSDGEATLAGGGSIRNAELTVTQDVGCSLQLTYLFTLPIEWNGKSHPAMTVPITVCGKYLMK